MLLQLSLPKCPKSLEIKGELPWGCVVDPLGGSSSATRTISAEKIARCMSCGAYINQHVQFRMDEGLNWICSICDAKNAANTTRYRSTSSRNKLAEFLPQGTDCIVTTSTINLQSPEANQNLPLFVALVDVSMQIDLLDQVKEALKGMVESLNDATMFALLTHDERRVGVYDLRSACAHVRYTKIVVDDHYEIDQGCDPSLRDVLDHRRMAVMLGQCREKALRAIKSLSNTIGQSHQTKPQGGKIPRNFGSAIDAVATWCDSFEAARPVRLVNFLAGTPVEPIAWVASADTNKREEEVAIDLGDSAAAMSDAEAHSVLRPASDNYQKMGERVAEVGLCVDIFLVGDTSCGAGTLAALCAATGGHLSSYPVLRLAKLTEDTKRRYARPCVFDCLVRVRTNSEICVTNIYGHVQTDNLGVPFLRMPGWSPEKCFGFEFGFTDEATVLKSINPPIVQVAFAYTQITQYEDSFKLEQRLRLCTKELAVSMSSEEMLETVDPEVCLALLTHKVARLVRKSHSLADCRSLLTEWMVALLIDYNQKNKLSLSNDKIDSMFSYYPNLQTLQRLLYGLMTGPVFNNVITRPDTRASYLFLYEELTPQRLRCRVYPVMVAFTSLRSQTGTALALSQAVLDSPVPALYLLDADHELVLFYPQAAKDETHFPRTLPDCGLRRLINRIQSERDIIVPLRMIVDDHSVIQEHLIDEANPNLYPGESLAKGYDAWIQSLSENVTTITQPVTKSI